VCKLDTLILKQKKLTVLDITGFFFRIRTQVTAFWKPLSSHPMSTVYCAYNNEVINYHSAEDNTKTGYCKTGEKNHKDLVNEA
jgi:hypothetical protein